MAAEGEAMVGPSPPNDPRLLTAEEYLRQLVRAFRRGFTAYLHNEHIPGTFMTIEDKLLDAMRPELEPVLAAREQQWAEREWAVTELVEAATSIGYADMAYQSGHAKIDKLRSALAAITRAGGGDG